jgi:hypothetical protein
VSSFPPPVEPLSTMYSMSPSRAEKLDRLSDLPTKPHDIPPKSEPPTKPRAALKQSEPPPRQRKSSRPARKPSSEPHGTTIEEVGASAAELADSGTYGAASVIPSAPLKTRPIAPSTAAKQGDSHKAESTHPVSSAAPRLNSEAPTAPAARALPSRHAGKQRPTYQPRIAAPSLGDGIKLVDIHNPPDQALLQALAGILRRYFEIEWASYCELARPAGEPTPAIGLRITDGYRDNVTAIIKDLCEASRKHGVEIDVLLIDGHDMLRKAREKGFVFYPWKPKPLGG